MQHTTRKFGSFAALTAMLMWTSCIFDTRDPQNPGTGGGGGGCVLDSPQKPFTCMADALKALTDGDYERSISDKFVFSPTTADSLDQNWSSTPCVYTNWNKDVEMEHIRFLVSDNAELTWNYGTPVQKINKNTFVRFEVNYTLQVRTNAAPADTTRYRGVAEIDVRNEGGNWRVTFWNETQTVPGSSTWGFLRASVRVQQGGGACPP